MDIRITITTSDVKNAASAAISNWNEVGDPIYIEVTSKGRGGILATSLPGVELLYEVLKQLHEGHRNGE